MKMKKSTVIIFLILFVSLNMFSQNNKTDVPVSGYIELEGGKLYYETAGQGENIVLIHDGTIHNEIWDNQFPLFSKSYRVTRYDRRGYGKSPNPTKQYSNIEDLNQIFTQLKIDKAILFGMSAGGGLAIDFTLKYPEKVTGLVLVGAVVSGYGYSNHMITRGGHIKSIQDIFSDSTKIIKYFGWEDPYTIYPGNKAAKEKCLKLLEANPQNVGMAKHRFLKQEDRPAVKFLSEIKVPTLVIVGEYDIPDVHAHSGVIESGIPGAKREIILNAGHLVPFEQPEAFNEVVFKFMNRTEFFVILNTKGVKEAAQYFSKKKQSDPNIKLFDENEMNMLGYKYMQSGKTEDAIELFILNTIAFPDAYNTFDSLGEAYMAIGKKELAIENYEKSYKLNPGNANALQQIKKMKEK
jgi:3-oxoadipate enol-lactonase